MSRKWHYWKPVGGHFESRNWRGHHHVITWVSHSGKKLFGPYSMQLWEIPFELCVFYWQKLCFFDKKSKMLSPSRFI